MKNAQLNRVIFLVVMIIIFTNNYLLADQDAISQASPRCEKARHLSSDPSEELIIAAKEGLGDFLNNIPLNDINRFGFANQEEIKEATLKGPYRIYTIKEEEILSFKESSDLLAVIEYSDLWYFPIIVGKDWRNMLHLKKVDRKWEAIDMGGTKLAADFQELQRTWKENEGYRFAILINYKHNLVFILINKELDYKLFPATSTRRFFPLKSQVYTPFEALSNIRNFIESN